VGWPVPGRRRGGDGRQLVHVDVKKLGKIPDGGGWRTHGRARGRRNGRATTADRKNNHRVIGYDYLHTATDDRSRLAYTEILADEKKETAAAFLARAHAWYAARGVAIERVLSGNGACYRSRAWAATCDELQITHKRTRPCRPQTDGKAERYHRTLADERAYARPYAANTDRSQALDPWLHTHNHHRGHTALKGLPPASRVTNLAGQYTEPAAWPGEPSRRAVPSRPVRPRNISFFD
jgi:transposase InsO family protein